MIKKSDFPIFSVHEELIYLDSAATSLTPKCVVDAVDEYYEKYNTNVHRGVYHLSYQTNTIFEEARYEVARFLGVNSEEIIFTKGTTDSLNMTALILKSELKAGDEILTSELEHHSCLLPFMNLIKEKGIKLKYISLNEKNEITFDNFLKAFSKSTRIVCLNHVSNVFGKRAPIEEIGKFLSRKNVYFVVDGAQAVGHFPVKLNTFYPSFYAFSAHKMLGPTGIGILYGKKELLKKFNPPFFGGEMNDDVGLDYFETKDIPYKFEAGTPPIAETFGLLKAIKFLNELGLENIEKHVTELARYVIDGLKKIKDIVLYNDTTDTGIISFNIRGVHPHDAVSFYDKYHFAMRAGHHCAQLIMKKLLVPGTLRISFHVYNTIKDADTFLEVTRKAVNFFKVELGV